MTTQQILHREPDARVRRSMAAGVLVSVLLVGGTLGLVALKVQQVRLSYRLDELRSARSRLDDVNRQLGVELAALRAPARIEQTARGLGLTTPRRDQVRLAREYVPGSGSTALSQNLQARGAQGEVRVR